MAPFSELIERVTTVFLPLLEQNLVVGQHSLEMTNLHVRTTRVIRAMMQRTDTTTPTTKKMSEGREPEDKKKSQRTDRMTYRRAVNDFDI